VGGSCGGGGGGCARGPRGRHDFSDRLTPVAAAQGALADEIDEMLAVQYGRPPFKSLFLALDLSLVDEACSRAIVQRAVDWFSPLSASTLRVLPANQSFRTGDTAQLELMLRHDGTAAAERVDVRWQLPAGTGLRGAPPADMVWDPAERVLAWTGDVARGLPRSWLVDVSVEETGENRRLQTVATIDAASIPLQRSAEIRVNTADLRSSFKAVDGGRTELEIGERARFSIVVRNRGSRPADPFVVTDTLPSGLVLVPDSALSTTGTVTETADAGLLVWRGAVGPGAEASLSYEAEMATYRGGWLVNRARIVDSYGEILERSAQVFGRPRLILPWLAHQIDADP
jgi:uncharacterized repeat protein (TIGR01451 family)